MTPEKRHITPASPRVSACPFADNLELAMPVSTTLKVWVDSAVRQAIYVPWLVLSITLPLPSTVLKTKTLNDPAKVKFVSIRLHNEIRVVSRLIAKAVVGQN